MSSKTPQFKRFVHHRAWLEKIVLAALEQFLENTRQDFKKKCPSLTMPKRAECRIKEFNKIIEKMERKQCVWESEDVFVENGNIYAVAVNDLVGGRLICATPQDVDTVVGIIVARSDLLRVDKSDAVKLGSGYRSHHIDATLRVQDVVNALEWHYPVEIQVRTLLQDAWANFGHDEFYKSMDDIPPVSLEISRHLAEVLSGLDLIGQAIRDEKLRKVSQTDLPGADETLVTPRTLSAATKRVLNVTLTEIESQRAASQLKAHGFDNIAAVEKLILNASLKDRIAKIHAELRAPANIGAFQLAFFAPIAAEGDDNMLREEIRRFYGFTEIRCGRCGLPLTSVQKSFIEEKTDLDSDYLCGDCSKVLRKCSTCDLMTLMQQCKTCKSKVAAAEII